jgi:Bacteriophage head to tail connecting protein.
MPKTRDEITAELIQRFEYADSWRHQFDDVARRCYKLYVGYRDPLPEELQGRSNLHIPRTYEQIDTWRARLVKAFFGIARPYIDFLPSPRNATPELMALNERKAALAAAIVDQQLERNVVVSVFYDYLTSMLIFPAAILGVGWRYERRKVRRREPIIDMATDPLTGMPVPRVVGWAPVEREAVTWDDNELVNINYFDFWPDPRGRDVDSCRFVFQREWCTQSQLEEKLAVLEAAGAGTVYPVDWESLRGAAGEFEDGAWELLTAVGLTPESSDGFWPKDDQRGHLFEVLHYWEDERHAILINRKQLAYDGASPYWRHGKKPFVAVAFEPLPGQFYGMSAVQLIEHLQHELNTHRNQRVDNVSLVLNRMWSVKRGADIDDAELVSRPHGIIHVDNQDDIQPLLTPDVTASAYQEEAITKQDMENTLATPGVVRGVTPTRRETALATATLASNASIRFDVKILLFDALGLRRMAYLMDCNNQQFIDTPRLVRLFGAQGPHEWRMVGPEEIIGEYDYRPAGANVDPAANKELRRQQLTQALAFAIQTNNPFIKKYELTREWLSSFDFRNVDKFLYSEGEVMQMQAAAQAQAVQQQAIAALAKQALAPQAQAQWQAPDPAQLPPGIA